MVGIIRTYESILICSRDAVSSYMAISTSCQFSTNCISTLGVWVPVLATTRKFTSGLCTIFLNWKIPFSSVNVDASSMI